MPDSEASVSHSGVEDAVRRARPRLTEESRWFSVLRRRTFWATFLVGMVITGVLSFVISALGASLDVSTHEFLARTHEQSARSAVLSMVSDA
jgi:hypothetical protein